MTISRCWPALLPTTMLLLACSRQPMASQAARFAATPPTTDGQPTDWTDSLRYDPTSKLQYQVLNDSRTVYVRLKVADQATQARVLRRGLTVWLDTTGRSQHQFGVRYPLGGVPPGAQTAPDPNATLAERRSRRTLALAEMREMELLNYKGSKEATLTDAQSPLGVKVALGFNAQDDLIYELAVPLRLLYRRLPALNPGPVAVVGVLVAGNTPGGGGVASPDGSVVGSQNTVGMRGSYGGGYGGRGSYGSSGIELITSVQLSVK
ncbi:hypothetical protein GCM10022409_18470 [Hymenobacter glaciei]|uniref:Lipoprotein n=1 Tax=Hymenobacter glaciei TaxID=877209 RepID=A0ABP7U1E3_9BACT